MTDDLIRVEQQALEQGAQRVMIAHDNIEHQLQLLRNEIGEINSYWKGDAADSYNSFMNEYDTKSTRINNDLIELAENLRKTHKHHTQNEEDIEERTRILLEALNA